MSGRVALGAVVGALVAMLAGRVLTDWLGTGPLGLLVGLAGAACAAGVAGLLIGLWPR